jgi:hypothetical protein
MSLDVKTEKWRMHSQKIIDSLPVMSYIQTRHKPSPVQPATKASSSAAAGEMILISDTPSKVTAPEVSDPVASVVESEQARKKTCTCALAADAAFTEDRCSVCMEHFAETDLVKQLPCKHFFHPPCAQGWIVDHNSCPACTVKIAKTP